MLEFLSGLTAMGFFVAGLFFFKFWRRTADALFTFFALAFWMLALNQTLTPFPGSRSRSGPGFTC